MPAVSRGLRFVYRAVTERDLAAALRKTETVWSQVLPDTRLNRAAVDLPNGRLSFEVDAAGLKTAQPATAALAEALGVDVEIQAGAADHDTSCTSRDNCVSPMKAGIRIYKGVIDSVPECTMAFHVIVYSANNDIQFLTSGHCGYSGSNSWLHPGLSGNHVIGSEQATLYRNNGYDVMRVSMLDAQVSDMVYAETRHLYGSAFPIVGTTVCDSKGRTGGAPDCGTVTSNNARWYSDTAGYYVYGGTTSGISQIGGDSGSPLYERYNSTQAYGVGIVDTVGGNFTILFDALSLFPADVWVPF